MGHQADPKRDSSTNGPQVGDTREPYRTSQENAGSTEGGGTRNSGGWSCSEKPSAREKGQAAVAGGAASPLMRTTRRRGLQRRSWPLPSSAAARPRSCGSNGPNGH